jgi:N-acetylmuramoyl-L-alanine amidase
MSRILAERITNNIAANVNFKNRGHKIRNDLPVIRDTKMPAVLIEAGFMSNKEELSRLTDPKIKQAIAQTIADTVIYFINEY